MNSRDQQIATINAATDGLRADRLEAFRSKILDSYRESSIVEKLTLVREITDREPTDFAVLTNQEARSVESFNDDSYYWNLYCEELGRSIALGEKAHILLRLSQEPGDGKPMDATSPSMESIMTGVEELQTTGYRPTLLVAPISLYVPVFKKLDIDWRDGQTVYLPDKTRIELAWSSKAAPIDRFVVLDPEAGEWQVKLDSQTGQRLTVAIGRHFAPAGGVTFLAETVARYDIVNRDAMYVIEVVGAPTNEFDPEEDSREEKEHAQNNSE